MSADLIDFNAMREAGRILAGALRVVGNLVEPGVTSLDLSKEAEHYIVSHGGIPAFIGYNGFPEAACVSVSEQVVHAIPTRRILREGDIVSVDCGVIVNGHYADACRTFPVGKISSQAARLIEVTENSLNAGISQAVPGNRIGHISFAIQHQVERNGFRVSLDFVGHGIGHKLHQDPQIPNYGKKDTGRLIEVGNCFAIEPVVFDGPIDYYTEPDKWTVCSKNGNLSAHFEDTIIIGPEGPEIITRI